MQHQGAVKHILRYIAGIQGLGVFYTQSNDCKLVRYTDSDWAGSTDDQRSTSRCIFKLGANTITWASKK